MYEGFPAQQTSMRPVSPSYILGLHLRILLLGELEGALPHKAMADHHSRLLPMAGLVRKKSFDYTDQIQILKSDILKFTSALNQKEIQKHSDFL